MMSIKKINQSINKKKIKLNIERERERRVLSLSSELHSLPNCSLSRDGKNFCREKKREERCTASPLLISFSSPCLCVHKRKRRRRIHSLLLSHARGCPWKGEEGSSSSLLLPSLFPLLLPIFYSFFCSPLPSVLRTRTCVHKGEDEEIFSHLLPHSSSFPSLLFFSPLLPCSHAHVSIISRYSPLRCQYHLMHAMERSALSPTHLSSLHEQKRVCPLSLFPSNLRSLAREQTEEREFLLPHSLSLLTLSCFSSPPYAFFSLALSPFLYHPPLTKKKVEKRTKWRDHNNFLKFFCVCTI